MVAGRWAFVVCTKHLYVALLCFALVMMKFGTGDEGCQRCRVAVFLVTFDLVVVMVILVTIMMTVMVTRY